MNPTTHKVLLESKSRILQQSVADSLSSMGIEVCHEPNDEIVLRLIQLSIDEPVTSLHETRVPIVFIGDLAKGDVEDLAAASVPFPFLSNELRKTVGRILQVPVRDSAAYDLADRPVPTSRRVQEPRSVIPPIPESNASREQSVEQSPLPVVQQLDTQADLPQVSHVEAQRASLHYAEETASPEIVVPPSSVTNHMPIDAIETISEAYIEKVVWEVVPRLAERILREEIAKLLREESTRS